MFSAEQEQGEIDGRDEQYPIQIYGLLLNCNHRHRFGFRFPPSGIPLPLPLITNGIMVRPAADAAGDDLATRDKAVKAALRAELN